MNVSRRSAFGAGSADLATYGSRVRMRPALARSVAAGVLSVLAVTAGLTAFAPAAMAATYDPSAPPYVFDANDVDTLTVFDATTGEALTSGSATVPLRNYYFVSSRDWNPGRTKASLFGYLAEDGKAQGAWSGQGLGSSTTYPVSTAPAPVSEAGTSPVARGDSLLTFAKLASSYPSNAPSDSAYFQLYQVRVKTTFPAPNPSASWASADIAIDVAAGTWRLLRPVMVTGTPTSTTLSVSPTSPAPTGTTQTLTAQVSPTSADGTVQFQSGSVDVGAAVTVSAGSASTTTVLPVGTHSLTATFTPSAPGQFRPGTSNSVGYTVSQTANPPAQTNLLSATPDDRSVVLTWSVPDSRGSAITAYTLEATSPTGATVTATVQTADVQAGPDVGTLRASLIGLTNDIEYTVRVFASNAIGNGAPSESMLATPKVASVPTAPEGLTALAGDGGAEVSWTAPTSDGGRAVTGYLVTATPSTGTQITATVSGLSTSLTGLTNGTEYAVSVRATNEVGTGPATAPVTVTPRPVTVPSVPLAMAVSAGDTSVAVTWDVPASDGASPITGYRTTATSPEQDPVVKVSFGTGTLITGLVNGRTYEITVVATNNVGDSPSTAPASATPVSVPTEPLAVIAKAGNRSASVTWTPPSSDGGSPITSYSVSATPVTAGSSRTITVTSPTADFSDLAPAVAYTVTVVAQNVIGSGPASTSVVVVPGPRLTSRTALTVPTTQLAGRRFVLAGTVSGVTGTVRVVLRTTPAGKPAVERAFNLTDGRLRVVLTASRHTSYRLTFAGTPQFAPSAATSRLQVRSVTSLTSVVLSGRTVSVVGRVLPAMAGRQVRLVEVSGGVVVLGVARTDSAGRYVLRVRLPRGTARLRVQASATATDLASVSVLRASSISWRL